MSVHWSAWLLSVDCGIAVAGFGLLLTRFWLAFGYWKRHAALL
jgi:hypothetical protein